MRYRNTMLIIALNIVHISAIANVYKYRIYCNTEAQNVYEWAETEPTTCPNNTAHDVNLNSISIMDQQGPSLFTIKEETTPTGGHYRAETRKINADAGPNVTTSMEYSWPFDISVLAIYLLPDATTADDILTVTIGPDMVYGVVPQDITAGSTVIPVSASVMSNIKKGYYVTIDDGTNSDAVGRVIAVNTADSTITVETPTAHAFDSANLVLVKVSVRPVDNLELVSGLQYSLGMKKIGGSYIPANTIVKVDYVNTPKVRQW